MSKSSKGLCVYCHEPITKNVKSLAKHLQECAVRNAQTDEKESRLLIMVEFPDSRTYWLLLLADPDITLKKLDTLLRGVWLECCGHMSEFSGSIGRKCRMSDTLETVFEHQEKITYRYDFGSTTELTIKPIGSFEAFKKEKKLQLLFQNELTKTNCHFCDKEAEFICSQCGEEPCCETHKEKHPCCIEEGGDDYMFLPLVNSPRAGVCGYEGAEPKTVKKYLP